MTAVSARGLFRATGKKSKPVAQRNLDGTYEYVEHLEREADEFYPTPAAPIRALLVAERQHLARFPVIWEPAAGDGALIREIEAVGHRAVASDLVDRGCGAEIKSFYDYDKPLAPSIITNPPFAECNWRDGKGRWITHAMDVLGVEYMALLLNWSWPGAGGLASLWQATPPARVYLMRWKIDFTGQGAPPNLNGWFVWDRTHVGEPILRMMDRSNPAQEEMFGSASA